MDVGETEVAAGVAESELLVIETEQSQNSRVQIVDVHRLFLGGETELVRRPVNRAALHAAARQPDGEPVVVMVAAVLLAGI